VKAAARARDLPLIAHGNTRTVQDREWRAKEEQTSTVTDFEIVRALLHRGSEEILPERRIYLHPLTPGWVLECSHETRNVFLPGIATLFSRGASFLSGRGQENSPSPKGAYGKEVLHYLLAWNLSRALWPPDRLTSLGLSWRLLYHFQCKNSCIFGLLLRKTGTPWECVPVLARHAVLFFVAVSRHHSFPPCERASRKRCTQCTSSHSAREPSPAPEPRSIFSGTEQMSYRLDD
jgi:hypothetical protein